MNRAQKGRVRAGAAPPAPEPTTVRIGAPSAAMLMLAAGLGYPEFPINRGNGETALIRAGQDDWQSFAVAGDPRDQLITLANVARMVVMAMPIPPPVSPLAALTLPDRPRGLVKV